MVDDKCGEWEIQNAHSGVIGGIFFHIKMMKKWAAKLNA